MYKIDRRGGGREGGGGQKSFSRTDPKIVNKKKTLYKIPLYCNYPL